VVSSQFHAQNISLQRKWISKCHALHPDIRELANACGNFAVVLKGSGLLFWRRNGDCLYVGRVEQQGAALDQDI
jgi:hypothetical protein